MKLNEKIKGKYLELKKAGKNEDFIENNLKIFINKAPKNILVKFQIEKDVVYIGN